VCGSRAWARARLSDVTPECAIYASSPTSLLRESEQLQNLLSESPNLLRDKSLIYKPNSKLITKALITKTIRLSMFAYKLLATYKITFKTILIITSL
jgi:hypothetical protein